MLGGEKPKDDPARIIDLALLLRRSLKIRYHVVAGRRRLTRDSRNRRLTRDFRYRRLTRNSCIPSPFFRRKIPEKWKKNGFLDSRDQNKILNFS